MLSVALSVAVLASLALIGGGGRMLWKRGDRRRAALMIAAGAVTLFNVWSWSGLIVPESAPAPASVSRR